MEEQRRPIPDEDTVAIDLDVCSRYDVTKIQFTSYKTNISRKFPIEHVLKSLDRLEKESIENVKIRAYVESTPKSRRVAETLVVNIDSCLDHDIKFVEFRVHGKVHRFSTKQISQFLDYVNEGLFE